MECYWMMISMLVFGLTSGQDLRSMILPIHYNVTLLPVLDDQRLCGHVSIDVKTTESTNVIEMHAANMQILNASIESVADAEAADPLIRTEESCFGGSVPSFTGGSGVIRFTVIEQRQMVFLIFKQPLHKDQLYRITIEYSAQISDDKRGFFRQSYAPPGQIDRRWIGATLMEPNFARRIFPCLDEPQHKATFQFTVGHHQSNRAISNTPKTSTATMKRAEGWLWSRFETTPIMSTYLLAVVVSDYVYTERRYQVCKRSVTMRFWSRPEHLSRMRFVIDLVPKMLSFLEKYFRMPFALNKIDFISLPDVDTFSAMENWGLIVFDEGSFLIDEATSSELERVIVAGNLAHELAHCWFGNLVTFPWWNEVWFTEGFTTYFSNVLLKAVMPEFEEVIDGQWMTSYVQVLNMDISEDDSNHPLSNDPKDPNDIIHLFDIITYQKAAILMKMVNSLVGDDSLRSGLIRFMKRYQYQNANSSQFWQILTEETRRKVSHFNDLETIMDPWVHQIGYPIVQCYRTDQTGQFMLTQKALGGEQRPMEGSNQTEPTWWIPISVTSTSSDVTQPFLWLSPNQRNKSISLPVNDTWILINGHSTGYYRVEYDEENWLMLADQLVTNHSMFSAATRMKLVDDAFHLAWTQVIPFRIAFQMIRYLRWVQDDRIRKIALDYVMDVKKYYPTAVPDMDKYILMLQAPQKSKDKTVCPENCISTGR